jgi:23S rRNA (pseudouridine1915-N3)-methyltransferase
MRIVVAGVGRLKQGPERELAARYHKLAASTGRSAGINGFDIIEIRESRASDPARRMTEESIAIANVIPEDGVIVILDERGESMSSPSFAGRLQGWRAQNKAAVAFIVGGHDGLAPTLREKAELTIAFGAATWPHRLARIMLLEQIYRAITILAGHPYHRG